MQEFLAHQNERKLRHNESLVDYIYSKDALLEKAPFTIPQPDRISMIIGDITEEKWQIALATQNTNTVEELIDRATALDAIRSAKQEHKKHSPKSQIRSSYTHDEQRRKYNPVTDDVRDITCWRCGNKGHASFMCSLPPPPRGSTIAQPRNTSRQNQYTNSQTNVQIPSSSSSTSSDNNAVKTISLNSSNSRRNNNNRNSTSGRSTTANSANNNSINCIRTETNRRALIPVIINNDTEIQALCDPCADITVIQQSCVPNDIVINPWTDGQFQVVDHEIKPIGWISLNIIVGFDWQQQVQARCTYDPNGSLCISTPTSFHLYECIHASKPSINCVSLHPPSLPSLDDVTLPEATPNIISSETNLIPKSAGLSTTQQAQLDAVIGKFTDVFYSNDNIGLCPYVEFKIELQHEKPIRCRPYRLSELIASFLKTQIEKWFLKQGIAVIPTHRTQHQLSLWSSPFMKVLLGELCNSKSWLQADTEKNAICSIRNHSFGRIISQDGVRDPERIAAIERYLTLKSIHEVRSFLGFANQFRKYIRNYAVIAKPLTSVLKGLEKKTNNAPIVLTEDQQRTFESLKTAITTAPFFMAETRYHSNELECTAVHWALTEKFRLYLLGHKFQLITDNYTTAYVVAKSAINRKFARYLVDLAHLISQTDHRPGKQNVIADHLSRFPTPPVCLTVTASYESDICVKQKRDDFCQYIFRLLREKNPNKRTMSIICNYNIDNNTLVRVNNSKSVVVIPKAMREKTLIACHDDVGHMDAKKNTLHNCNSLWWPNMRKDCKAYVRSCHKCQIVNRRTANAYGLLQQLPIPSTPWEIVSADHIICLPETERMEIQICLPKLTTPHAM
ncbi:Retrovirus-related Pol polyprotein like [Argiope bruennichi]|uniref:RNA-directed DNA polymerase n=1 Tax=Argiope bruennichi TaxID=94029 RepID=A0A8T0E017_ARGBR|nr:Retrovirus-related Pol polyprotein like [Argiope bruennichi]